MFFDDFNGYNDYKKKRIKRPQLSSESCKSHSDILFTILSKPFIKSWGPFRDDLEELALCLQDYSDYLTSCNMLQKMRHSLPEPCKKLSEDVTIEHRPVVSSVDACYAKLEEALAQKTDYDPLCFSEGIHLDSPFLNRMQRHRYFEKLHLKQPIDILRYDPGGNTGNVVIVWKVPLQRSTDALITDGARMLQMLRPILPVYHTREMRAAFARRCSTMQTSLRPHILRNIYADLALDYTQDKNHSIDERVREGILGDDPDLVFDLRHLNKGRPGESFKTFFEVLEKKVETITAADERRHGTSHFSEFISIPDLRRQTAAECPEGTPIPSESTIMFSFMPKNMYSNTARHYTGAINLQHKVQTRQLRQTHVDAHYCAAVFKYMREMAVELRDRSVLLSIDDKSKVDIGEPGLLVATGVRGRKTIVPVSSALSALDHDMQKKGTIVPSVCLNINIPEKPEESFFRGQVSVTYKDAIFEPSCPFRHAAELKEEIIRHRNDNGVAASVVMIYSDGGPDHRLTYESVKISLICLFKCLDIDMLIAGRTAPGHSWANKVERVMSILNLGFQNAAFERERCSDDNEKLLKNCNSMESIRKAAEKHPQLRPAWLTAMQPVKDLLEARTKRLSLKDTPFIVHPPASSDQIDAIRSFVPVIDPALDLGKLTKKDVNKCPQYRDFMAKHCRSHHYTFQIRKCNDRACCGERTSEGIAWLPDPVPQDEDPGHYKQFSDLFGKVETDDSHRPSLKQETTRVAAAEQGCDSSMFTAQRVRMVASCSLCGKPRCVYSGRKMTDREKNSLNRTLARFNFICGANVTTDGDVMESVAFTNIRLTCESPIEFAYFSSKVARLDLCSYCAEAGAKCDEQLKQRFKVVLPMCEGCKNRDRPPLKRQPFGGLKRKSSDE